jgi:heterodisulfide reductase subunit C2
MNASLATTEWKGAFLAEVEKQSQGNLSACLQCKKCTSGCPVAGWADIKAHELVRLAQLGCKDELLGSRMIWECTSCQTCVTRCPQKVDIASLNDALRRMSRREHQVHAETVLPVFNDIFLRTVRKRGRMYEAGLMASFKLRTLRLFSDMGKLPMMLWKGKMPLWSAKVGGRKQREEIFRRARDMNGGHS